MYSLETEGGAGGAVKMLRISLGVTRWGGVGNENMGGTACVGVTEEDARVRGRWRQMICCGKT